MANPKSYYFSFARFIPILLLISVASMASALLWMVSYSDTTAIGQADIYWVFYLHIAAAVVAMICYLIVAVGSMLQLMNRDALMPIVFSHGFAPSGFVMTLTALLILLLFFGAFISLSSSRTHMRQEVCDRRASISALVGLVLIPTMYVIFDLFTPMAHDLDNSLLRSNGRDAYILMALFAVNLSTYTLAMAFSRCRTVILERERRAIWAQEAALEGEL